MLCIGSRDGVLIWPWGSDLATLVTLCSVPDGLGSFLQGFTFISSVIHLRGLPSERAGGLAGARQGGHHRRGGDRGAVMGALPAGGCPFSCRFIRRAMSRTRRSAAPTGVCTPTPRKFLSELKAESAEHTEKPAGHRGERRRRPRQIGVRLDFRASPAILVPFVTRARNVRGRGSSLIQFGSRHGPVSAADGRGLVKFNWATRVRGGETIRPPWGWTRDMEQLQSLAGGKGKPEAKDIVLPNMLTAANLFCGFVGVTKSWRRGPRRHLSSGFRANPRGRCFHLLRCILGFV